jgi:hypothetical protein
MKFLIRAVLLCVTVVLLTPAANAWPTCYDCNFGCVSSIAYFYKNCVTSGNICYASDYCWSWGASAAAGTCKDRVQWQLVTAETFTAQKESHTWRLAHTSTRAAIKTAAAIEEKR